MPDEAIGRGARALPTERLAGCLKKRLVHDKPQQLSSKEHSKRRDTCPKFYRELAKVFVITALWDVVLRMFAMKHVEFMESKIELGGNVETVL